MLSRVVMAIVLATFGVFTGVPSRTEAQPPLSWGDVLVPAAAWNGVDVHDNAGVDPTDPYEYGYRWQCVELAQRFFNQKIWGGYLKTWQDTSGTVIPDAASIYTQPISDFLKYVNGSTLPRWGDLLIFERDASNVEFGHVAVVTGTASGRVYFVQQNFLSIQMVSMI